MGTVVTERKTKSFLGGKSPFAFTRAPATRSHASHKGEGQSDFLSQAGRAASNPEAPLPARQELSGLSLPPEVVQGERRGEIDME